MDDIHPAMQWERFELWRDLLTDHSIRPIIGVTPDFRFGRKSSPDTNSAFWREVRQLQSSGWTVALHGCHHLANTTSAGSLGICQASEFAGLPLERQLEILRKGKALLEVNGVQTNTFMAPWHSFDDNTLLALRKLGFTAVTDGYGFAAFQQSGLRFLPQQFENPRAMPFGIWTFAIHPESVPDSQFSEIRTFLTTHRERFLSFEEALVYPIPWYLRPVDAGFSLALRGYRRWRLCRGIGRL
jgi:peptidoglycan/xylan/chitin deacetylase (PgdA/CDA1 family)